MACGSCAHSTERAGLEMRRRRIAAGTHQTGAVGWTSQQLALVCSASPLTSLVM